MGNFPLSFVPLFFFLSNFVSAVPAPWTFDDLESPKLMEAWLQKQVQFYSPPFANRAEAEYKVDQLLYNTSVGDFGLIRGRLFPDEHAPPPKNKWDIDWTSDACTQAPDKPWGFDFKTVCQHLDFGTTNLIRHGRWVGCELKKLSRLYNMESHQVCTEYNEAHADEFGVSDRMTSLCHHIATMNYGNNNAGMMLEGHLFTKIACTEAQMGEMSLESLKLRNGLRFLDYIGTSIFEKGLFTADILKGGPLSEGIFKDGPLKEGFPP